MKTTEGKGFRNGIINIPRNTRMIYIHALQSYIFNKLISERIKKYGMELCNLKRVRGCNFNKLTKIRNKKYIKIKTYYIRFLIQKIKC